MRPVALVTYTAARDLTEDDRLVCMALNARGVPTEAVCWDDPAVEWAAYQQVVIRSCWDYARRAAEFRAWALRMQREGIPLRNSAATVLWNMDKQYLAQLAAGGIATVPTHWLKQGTPASLAAVLDAQGWERAVVKPTISASGENTWLADAERAEEDQPALDALLAAGDVMVQPFMTEIATAGEWSLIFFAGKYSHAVLKRAAGGEFRVQEEFGGSATAQVPSPALIAQAREVLLAAPESALYARVDGVVAGGRFVLMELELIEPFLFLGSAPGAAERFAAAIEWANEG